MFIKGLHMQPSRDSYYPKCKRGNMRLVSGVAHKMPAHELLHLSFTASSCKNIRRSKLMISVRADKNQ